MKKVMSVVLVFCLVTVLSACGSGGAPSAPDQPAGAEPAAPEGPEYGGILRLTSLDTSPPFGLPWEMQMMDMTFLVPYGEALLLETANGDLSPWLATSWEVDPENLEIRFKLREGVQFSDGSDFNAEIVVWNAQKAIESQAMNQAVIGAEVRGEYEVAMLLSNYVNSTLAHFASHVFVIVSKENYDKNGEDYARNNPVGTGPFVLSGRVPGFKVSFTKNENYWQEGKPYLDGVEYIEMSDEVTQNAAVSSDQESETVDVLRTFSGEQSATLAELSNLTVKSLSVGPSCLAPSSRDENSPLSKLEVRQAIFHAIDRASICAARGFGFLTPAYQMIPEPFKGYFPEYVSTTYSDPYDPDKAKALLAQAGYPEGFSTKLIAPPGSMDQDAVVAVQNMLTAVGVRTELELPQSGAATDLRMNGWDGIMVIQLRAMPNTTSTIRLNLDPDYDFLPSVWRPAEEMRSLYLASRESLLLEHERVQAVHKLLLDGMVVIPVYDSYENSIIKNNVHDSGFSEYSQSTIWLPWAAWKSAK
jgi:peptide/nickel transport system substrate-binding protein